MTLPAKNKTGILPPSRIRLIAALAAIGLILVGGYGYFAATPDFTFSDAGVPSGFRRLASMSGESSPAGLSPTAMLSGDPEGTATTPDASLLCRNLFADSDAPVSGSEQPAVTVVEFTDYQCPYCRRLSGILDRIEKTEPDIRHIYKEWPILGPASIGAARAAIAADRQGMYLPFRHRLMQSRFVPTRRYLFDLAAELGLDIDRFKTDMNDPGLDPAFARTDRAARALGFIGTPGLVVGRTIVGGAIGENRLRALIALERRMVGHVPC